MPAKMDPINTLVMDLLRTTATNDGTAILDHFKPYTRRLWYGMHMSSVQRVVFAEAATPAVRGGPLTMDVKRAKELAASDARTAVAVLGHDDVLYEVTERMAVSVQPRTGPKLPVVDAVTATIVALRMLMYRVAVAGAEANEDVDLAERLRKDEHRALRPLGSVEELGAWVGKSPDDRSNMLAGVLAVAATAKTVAKRILAPYVNNKFVMDVTGEHVRKTFMEWVETTSTEDVFVRSWLSGVISDFWDAPNTTNIPSKNAHTEIAFLERLHRHVAEGGEDPGSAEHKAFRVGAKRANAAMVWLGRVGEVARATAKQKPYTGANTAYTNLDDALDSAIASAPPGEDTDYDLVVLLVLVVWVLVKAFTDSLKRVAGADKTRA